MAFVNEYVPEADYEKYDMMKVCAEHNRLLGRDRNVWFEYWTVDREKDAFLVRIWRHSEAEFDGHAFYWKGEWMFFDMRSVDSKYDQVRNAIWFLAVVKGFAVPDRLVAQREAVIANLKEAITIQAPVTNTITDRAATIDFIAE